MHQCAEGCRRARHSQCLSPNTDMDLELLASSQPALSPCLLSFLSGSSLSWQTWILMNLAKRPPHGDLFERREEFWGVEGGGLPGDPPVMNAGKVTAVRLIKSDGYIGHFVPTQSPWGESARSDSPQSVLHYHFQLPPRKQRDGVKMHHWRNVEGLA